MPERLFVYGTLRRAYFNPWSLRLWAHSRFAGCGTVQGKIIPLGPYFGLVDGTESIAGEVAELIDSSILPALDAYEGPSYHRTECTVQLTNGTSLPCWVYRYQADK